MHIHGALVKLLEMVKNKRVFFMYYRAPELWYKTSDGFEFPVPLEDTGTAVFLAEDRAIIFMRWINRHMKNIALAQLEQQSNEK